MNVELRFWGPFSFIIFNKARFVLIWGLSTLEQIMVKSVVNKSTMSKDRLTQCLLDAKISF